MSDMLQSPHVAAASSSTPMHITVAGLTQVLDISPDALVVVDAAGKIVMVNAQAATLFGYSSEELQGQSLEGLLPERVRNAHVARREGYIAAPRTRPMGVGLSLSGRRKDGLEFPVDISLRPLLLDGVPHVIAAVRDMTEQRRGEQERAQQLQQIRLQTRLINQSHDAILMRDPIDRVLAWNRGAEELYGWTAQEALGRVTHAFLKTHFLSSRAEVDVILTQQGQWEGELTHTRRDGTTIIVESRQLLVRDENNQPIAILEINRDITERRQLEQAKQAEHAETAARLSFLQQVLDALPSSIYLVYGHDARLLLANQTADKVWGAQWQQHQPMQEFLASNGIRLFNAQGRSLLPAEFVTMLAVQQGETTLQRQETIRRADGSSLPILVNAVALNPQQITQPLQQTGEAAGETPHTESEALALVVHQDVTALKEAEYLKDEFVGIAAHELRAPLAVLKGYADMLLVQSVRQRGPELADWQQEALDEIKQAVARLVELTEELLAVTRLQAGRLVLNTTPTDLVPLTRRVVDSLQKTTTQHQIALHAALPSLVADIDAGRIEQVLVNVIGNAIKYSPQGGPVAISLWEEPAEQTIHISVQDHGIGIPEHQHGQIFGRFMRADNAQSWGISGTGLGLYLSRELVELHGGHLWFESAVGKGSTFILSLPIVCICDTKGEVE